MSQPSGHHIIAAGTLSPEGTQAGEIQAAHCGGKNNTDATIRGPEDNSTSRALLHVGRERQTDRHTELKAD